MTTAAPPTPPTATRRNAACRRAEDCDRCDACRPASARDRPAPALVRLGRPVRFRLPSTDADAGLAAGVSLVLCAPEGGSTTTPMDRQPDGSWGLTLRLSPGTYRYRYQTDQGGETPRPSSADAALGVVVPDEPYAILDVGPAREGTPPGRAGVAGEA